MPEPLPKTGPETPKGPETVEKRSEKPKTDPEKAKDTRNTQKDVKESREKLADDIEMKRVESNFIDKTTQNIESAVNAASEKVTKAMPTVASLGKSLEKIMNQFMRLRSKLRYQFAPMMASLSSIGLMERNENDKTLAFYEKLHATDPALQFTPDMTDDQSITKLMALKSKIDASVTDDVYMDNVLKEAATRGMDKVWTAKELLSVMQEIAAAKAKEEAAKEAEDEKKKADEKDKKEKDEDKKPEDASGGQKEKSPEKSS